MKEQYFMMMRFYEIRISGILEKKILEKKFKS